MCIRDRKRPAHRVADDLTDAAPADESRHREQAGRHRAAELFPPPALGEGAVSYTHLTDDVSTIRNLMNMNYDIKR